jgi:hypothetical protein
MRGAGNIRRGAIPFDAGAVVPPTTLADTDAATGTETGTIVVTLPGSDSGTFTDTGVATVTATGAETAGDTEAGTVSATVPGSDSGTGTDAQVSIVSPVAGSDTPRAPRQLRRRSRHPVPILRLDLRPPPRA